MLGLRGGLTRTDIRFLVPFRQLLTTAVRAYDGTTRTAQGIVRLNLKVGPLVRSTLFHVADILATFFLLGRPWIHANLVVASSYHKCLKFPMNGTIITVVGELDVEEECIMLDSQDWFTSDVPTLIATPSTQASFKFSPFFSICIDPRPSLVSFVDIPNEIRDEVLQSLLYPTLRFSNKVGLDTSSTY